MSMEAHMKKYYASMFDDARSGSPRRSPRNPPKFKGFRKKKKANGLVESGQSSVRHKKVRSKVLGFGIDCFLLWIYFFGVLGFFG